MSTLYTIIAAAAIAGYTLCQMKGWPSRWYCPLFTVMSCIMAAYWAARGNLAHAGLQALFAVIWAWLWHRDRRNKRRDPAAKSFGYKARALIANLVSRQRKAAEAPAG